MTALPRRRTVRRAIAWAAIAAVVVVLAPFAWVQAVGQSAVVADADDVPAGDAALVLGAGLRPDGSPSTYLRRRLDAAAELYAAGAVARVLVSGDGARPEHDEPAAMRDWLLDRGVPAGAIVLDRGGLDTHASCTRAVEVFEVEAAVVVTQDYHLRRALFSCRSAGLDAVGIGVSAASVRPVQAVVWRLREVPASVKAAWDAATS